MNIVESVILYISAASDLEAEREILGRTVAEIPLDIGWRIVDSPIRGESPDLEIIAKADIHLLVLGSDIRAPIGVEWFTARQAGLLPTLFLKEAIPRTPAAQDFIRHLAEQAVWHPFKENADLRRQVVMLLIDHLVKFPSRYFLTPDEIERLNNWRNDQVTKSDNKVEKDHGGTGESSVILTAARYLPREGVLIQPNIEKKDR